MDIYPNATVAYSLRKLRSAYTGSAIIVRRSSDNAEQDFGFINNELDSASLLSFIGANNGPITTLKGQVNTIDTTQVTAVNQPILVNAGTIITSGSKPAIQGGSTLGLRTANQNLSAITDFWMFFVIDVTNATTLQNIFETSTNFNNVNGAINVFIQSGVVNVGQKVSSGYSIKSYPISTGRKLITVRFRTGQTATNASEVWINGNSVSGTVTFNNNSTALTSDQPLHFFARAGSSVGFLGKYQLAVIYGSDQSSNRIGIESKINEMYGIY